MNFSVQRYVEDYFHQRNLRDTDQYAVRVASLFMTRRPTLEGTAFLAAMRRVRTVFFSNNPSLVRRDFEQALLTRLDRKFQKKTFEPDDATRAALSAGAAGARKLKRRSLVDILDRFRRCVAGSAEG